MPIDGEPKLSSDSDKSNPGWWTKCLPTFSVRGRHRSPEEISEPDMTVADSPRKKRRASSILTNRRKPTSKVMAVEVKVDDMASSIAGARAIFDSAVDDAQGLKAYNTRHDKLLAKENETAWDREVRPKGTSKVAEVERKADAIVRAIREYERRITFGNLPSEALPGPETLDMGGQFLTNKDRIEQKSMLYRIAHAVPKGALLHLHFNSELYPERLLKEARTMDNMYIRSIRPLVKREDLDITEVVFNVMDEEQVEKGVNIFSPTYPGDATNWKTPEWKFKVWMKWSDFQQGFDERFHKDFDGPGFHELLDSPEEPEERDCGSEVRVKLNRTENWLYTKMVLSPEEAYGPAQTVNGVWARFNQATRAFKGLMNYEKVYIWYIEQAIDRMIDEKIMYAELRPMLLDKFIPSTNGKRQITNAEQMKLIIDGVQAKQAKLLEKNELHKFPFGLKIIYCTPRSIPKPLMREEMKQCIDLKLQFPNLICGFDLVGAEDRANHIGFYREELLAFQKTCENTFIEGKPLDIPFLFHAGETLLDTGGSSDPKNSNLYDAALLNSKRIGHGFALMKHPHLLDNFRRIPNKPGSGICVELCPISNELLHLCRNIKEHPFPELLAAGIPCTVNSDNPSLFSNSMSHEFYQIMVGAPTMSLYSWKQLARWSIEYSCLNEEEKKEGQKHLDDSWKQFCAEIAKLEPLLMKEGCVEIDDKKAEAAFKDMPKGSRGLEALRRGLGRPYNNEMPGEDLIMGNNDIA